LLNNSSPISKRRTYLIFISPVKEILSQLTYSGVGVGMTRDTSTLMVGQYFKRRRELVEILLGRGQFLSGKSDPCKCSNAANIKHTLYQKSDLYIPRNETAGPRFQFLHSCICERFIYSQDRSTYFAAAK
jgi:hypothetical protein